MVLSCGVRPWRPSTMNTTTSASATACLRLQRHLVHDAFLGDRLETARVDDQEGSFANAAFAVVAVARQAWHVGHQRVARTGQAVE